MCICDDDYLCPLAADLWTKLHEDYYEGIEHFLAPQDMLNAKDKYKRHRTNVLLEKKILPPGGTAGFQFYPDWRQRLDPEYNYKK